MRATHPYIEVPGDNEETIALVSGESIRPRLMARSANCLGMDPNRAVWRCGFRAGSETAEAFGLSLPEDTEFLWVLADRHSGEVIQTWQGWACNLPLEFQQVLDYEPTERRIPV